MFSSDDTQQIRSQKNKISKTSIDRHKQRLTSESLTALNDSTSSRTEDKPWYLLSFDELVTEYNEKQTSTKAISIDSDIGSFGDSTLENNNKHIEKIRHPVGFGSSSAPRIAPEDVINYPGNKHDSIAKSYIDPKSSEAIKSDRRKQKELRNELLQVKARIDKLKSEKTNNYHKIKQTVKQIEEKRDELVDIQEKGHKLYISAANTLSNLRSQQAARLTNVDSLDADSYRQENSPEEIIFRASTAPIPTKPGRRSSTQIQLQQQYREHKQMQQQTPANSMVRAANVAALRFQQARDGLWTKAGQQHAEQILAALEEREYIRMKIRNALIKFGRQHAERQEILGIKRVKTRPLIKFVRPIASSHAKRLVHHSSNLHFNANPSPVIKASLPFQRHDANAAMNLTTNAHSSSHATHAPIEHGIPSKKSVYAMQHSQISSFQPFASGEGKQSSLKMLFG